MMAVKEHSIKVEMEDYLEYLEEVNDDELEEQVSCMDQMDKRIDLDLNIDHMKKEDYMMVQVKVGNKGLEDDDDDHMENLIQVLVDSQQDLAVQSHFHLLCAYDEEIDASMSILDQKVASNKAMPTSLLALEKTLQQQIIHPLSTFSASDRSSNEA